MRVCCTGRSPRASARLSSRQLAHRTGRNTRWCSYTVAGECSCRQRSSPRSSPSGPERCQGLAPQLEGTLSSEGSFHLCQHARQTINLPGRTLYSRCPCVLCPDKIASATSTPRTEMPCETDPGLFSTLLGTDGPWTSESHKRSK